MRAGPCVRTQHDAHCINIRDVCSSNDHHHVWSLLQFLLLLGNDTATFVLSIYIKMHQKKQLKSVLIIKYILIIIKPEIFTLIKTYMSCSFLMPLYFIMKIQQKLFCFQFAKCHNDERKNVTVIYLTIYLKSQVYTHFFDSAVVLRQMFWVSFHKRLALI